MRCVLVGVEGTEEPPPDPPVAVAAAAGVSDTEFVPLALAFGAGVFGADTGTPPPMTEARAPNKKLAAAVLGPEPNRKQKSQHIA